MNDSAIPASLAERFRRLQRYVGWCDGDVQRVHRAAQLVRPAFTDLIDDFYGTIETEPEAAKVITGGQEQIARLKVTLCQWLDEMFQGPWTDRYAAARWRVGWRHVEIGLDSVFTAVAFSRLRSGLTRVIEERWVGEASELSETLHSVHRLLDLDLAIIQDAYESEYVSRQRRSVRQRSEAAFRRLVEAAGSVIVILRLDHSIAYFNPYAEELTGYAASAVQGKDYIELFLPERERLGVVEQLNANQMGQPTLGYENSIRCRDGSERCLVWNAQRLEDFDGKPAILAVGQDITDRKVAEERALQSERLAAIGQTVTGLAHESRNAFQRSQACLELLALELEDRPEELELVSRIQRALDHLHRLYEEVRDYAAPIKLDRQLCDLAHLWRDAWSHLEVSRAGKAIALSESLECGDLALHVDWFALGQVFRNIFENAIAACSEPGSISVSCESTALEEHPAVRIRIQDSGPGIPRDARSRVFDAFFTTKTKGTGLGMAIARRIVEAHGGTIELGDVDEGAEFVIVLPRS
ncbi:MAG: PAS domain S-box protein [Planctomycetaceae bacterium]|nr:PAS domain S-box protein [Planctomycetales bacterium]MCB9923230.1 PAS domain S-box protein [Planctomycetaceae bacterium]